MNCFKGTIKKYPAKIKINNRKDVFIKNCIEYRYFIMRIENNHAVKIVQSMCS